MGLLKIAGPFRVDTFTNQVGIDYPLNPRPLPPGYTRIQYQVVVLASSVSFQVGILLYHGPRHDFVILHSTPITVQAPVSSGVSSMVSGDASTTTALAPWIRPLIRTGSGNAAAQWAVIEVYELIKRR